MVRLRSPTGEMRELWRVNIQKERSLIKKKCDAYDGLRLRTSELGVSSSEYQWPSKKVEVSRSEHQWPSKKVEVSSSEHE